MNRQPCEHILVCVTSQETCRRLIRVGADIAEKAGLPLKVLCVMRPGSLSGEATRTLQVLYNVSGCYGAEMTVLFNDEPALAAAVHARQKNAGQIIIGEPGADGTLFMETIRGLLPDLPLTVVDKNSNSVTLSPLPGVVPAGEKS